MRCLGIRPLSGLALTAAIGTLALLASACIPGELVTPGIPGGANGGSGTPTATASLDDIELLAALRSFDDCDALLKHLRTETADRVGPYGLDDGRYGPDPFGVRLEDEAMAEAADMAESDSATVTSPADSRQQTGISGDDSGSFSETNVQVAGVDEPDIIKTDGMRILAIAGGLLHYVDLNGEEPAYRGSVKLDTQGWGQEILMHGDRALIFTNTYGDHLPPIADDDLMVATSAQDIAFHGRQSALVQEVDLSDPSAMEVVSELQVEGQYLSARSVGSTAWLSLSSNPLQFEFVYPSGPSAEEAAERINKEIAATAELGAWLPAYRFGGPDGAEAGLLPDCEHLYTPPDFSGFTVLSVLTIDMSEPLTPGDAASVLADGHTLYSSGRSLYFASSALSKSDDRGDRADNGRFGSALRRGQWRSEWTTTVHKFSVSESGPARYEATGEVYGHLLNQFSMDEHNGHFRIATTIGEPWNTENSQSQVVVLRQQGRRLNIVGSVGGLGKGERIYSVRYAGDVGYVVTFRQVDPLYVLDLSDPTSPSVAGELKIPGFSTYLHPLGDGLLAGIGQQADERGRTQGTKVSLFDVSDPAAPAELDVLVFPGGYSEAEWDHRAFLSWPAEEMLAIPLNQRQDSPIEPLRNGSAADSVSRPDGDKPFTGAVALRVDRDGVSEIGRIAHRQSRPAFPGCRPVVNRDLLDDWVLEADEIQICPPGAPVEHPGLSCETWDADAARKQWPDLQISATEALVICWAWTPPIQRLLVANGALWTMTEQAIQANDLETLEYETKIAWGSK